MEPAIRAFLKDPTFGIPIILLAIVLFAHAAVFLRSVANGPTPIIPSLRVMAADGAIVLMVALLFLFTKAMDLFTPDAGTTIGGIDVAPFYSTVGPLIFAGFGLALAVWLVTLKLKAIKDSVYPPAATPVSTVVVQSETPQQVSGSGTAGG